MPPEARGTAPDPPALLVLWERALGELLDHTGRFPRAARFSFAARIDACGLDILEALAAARYAPAEERLALLRGADRRLAVLRVLLRVAHRRELLSTGGLERLAANHREAGQMLGGWIGWLATSRP